MGNFDYNTYPDVDPFEWHTYPDYHSVVSIQICELANAGFFDLTREDWDFGPKFSQEQHRRLCEKITNHYWYREIALVPPGLWKREFLRKMNEIMPKYMKWYELVYSEDMKIGHTYDFIDGDYTKKDIGVDQTVGNKTTNETQNVNENESESERIDDDTVKSFTQTDTVTERENDDVSETSSGTTDTYNKSREIFSDFPQTSLAGSNQDYASTGNDEEGEQISEQSGTGTKERDRDLTKNGRLNSTENINRDIAREKSRDLDKDSTRNEREDTTGTKNTQLDGTKTYHEKREHIGDPIEYIDDILKFDNVDNSIINEIEPLFSCFFAVNINGW